MYVYTCACACARVHLHNVMEACTCIPCVHAVHTSVFSENASLVDKADTSPPARTRYSCELAEHTPSLDHSGLDGSLLIPIFITMAPMDPIDSFWTSEDR